MRPDSEATARSAVRVNQLGYLPGGPKWATLVSESLEPISFDVLDERGRVAYSGQSRPWPVRPEPTSGLDVHLLDFSDLITSGSFLIRAGEGTSHRFMIDSGLYVGLTRDALRFFYLQRSGCAVEEIRAPGYGRPAGHAGIAPNTGDTAVPAWQGPDAGSLYPGWAEDGLFDVSGGWYDAGDHGKYVTSGALPVWQLLATVELVRRHPAPAGLEAALVEEARWQLDWLLRMQVPPGPRVRRPGIPPRARNRVGAPGCVAAPRPHPPGAAPAVDRGRSAPCRGRCPRVPDPAPVDSGYAGSSWPRPRWPTPPPELIRA